MHHPAIAAALILAAALWLPDAAAASPSLFQGNSVIITPSKTSVLPQDANITSAHFYSYIGESGYFSFGWWLTATPTTNFSRCSPSQPYDWYEYTPSGSCNATTGICTVHALNYPAGPPSMATIDTNYVAWLVTVGPGQIGNLAVSYFDEAQGSFAVGSRRYLSGPGLGRDEADECKGGFARLVEIQKEWALVLGFELVDPCQSVYLD
ncbi:hypothetical protein B0T25DRAFT_303220 [Lasiosphaeria hispida]|uniref:Ecp2 effector protein domain-containing protein n=1 Tax=Lasiosphaeria hispida TaxID=260671 RepID=A0AAJ0M951_9PEZI|nr:hypothetical protein B0T25DRAFT_303220 [Lasiosphaeria hispida]